MSNAPKIPDYTCGGIDDAKHYLGKAADALEQLRESNSELRKAALYYQEQCEELEGKLFDTIEEYEKRIEELERQLNS